VSLATRFDFTLNDYEAMLGMRILIDYDKCIMRIDQEMQARKMLAAFGMDNMNLTTVSSPMPSDPPPTEEDVPREPAELARCRALFDLRAAIGHLNFLVGGTRPGDSITVKILSKFMNGWGMAHIRYCKHLMRWVATTVSMPLILRGGYDMGVQVFTDASHASDVDSRRSLLGIVIKICGNTCLWVVFYSSMVAHSSCESEILSLDKGATLAMLVKYMIEVMGRPVQGPITIFVDNQAAIDIGSNPVQASRNLHMHARYFYVRDLVRMGVVKILHLASKDQLADILVTFKGSPCYNQLLRYLMGCAIVVADGEGKYRWDTSLLL